MLVAMKGSLGKASTVKKSIIPRWSHAPWKHNSMVRSNHSQLRFSSYFAVCSFVSIWFTVQRLWTWAQLDLVWILLLARLKRRLETDRNPGCRWWMVVDYASWMKTLIESLSESLAVNRILRTRKQKESYQVSFYFVDISTVDLKM